MPKQASNWIMGPLLGLLNAQGKTIETSPVSSQNLARLLKLIDKDLISGKIAKTVFEEMAKTGRPPREIVEEKGLVQVTDESAIKPIVLQVLDRHSSEVENYKNGKTRLFGFFVGQIMKETDGRANPEIVTALLRAELGK